MLKVKAENLVHRLFADITHDFPLESTTGMLQKSMLQIAVCKESVVWWKGLLLKLLCA